MLPKKILVIPSREKLWHEKWNKKRDELNFPHPYRLILTSTPNSGKTNLCKNILLRAKPMFEKIYLFHYDPDCEEYEDVDIIKIDEMLEPKDSRLKQNIKSLLIVEDSQLAKEDIQKLDRLFGYASTHKGLSIIFICQNFFKIPPMVRRMANIFAIWKKSSDFDSLYYIGRKFGLNKDEFMSIMNQCKSRYDFILFDMSGNPDKIRLNGYIPISEYNDRM